MDRHDKKYQEFKVSPGAQRYIDELEAKLEDKEKEPEKMPTSLKIIIGIFIVVTWGIMWGLLKLIESNPVPWP